MEDISRNLGMVRELLYKMFIVESQQLLYDNMFIVQASQFTLERLYQRVIHVEHGDCNKKH